MTKCVIIVTYEPELNNLKRLSECVQDAGFTPVIVDNSLKNPVRQKEIFDGSKIISMGTNAGIAAAQNAGIQYALHEGAEIFGFFDQDSDADAKLIGQLEENLKIHGDCVVAPLALEKETLKEYPVQRLNKIGYPSDVYVKGCTAPQKVDIVISSGMMTTAGVLSKVGNFDEDFFIDFVDIEWCLRCKKAGIPVFVIPDAILMHKIGKETVAMDKLEITVHSPVRTYYKVRNAFLLLYKKAGVVFSVRQILPALLHNLLLIFRVEKKREYAKYYITGILHGIFGVRGSYGKG